MYYYYDGTYPGFLTAVYEIYHYGTSKLEGIGPEGGEVRLFGADFIVKTNFLYAEKVAASFEKKCGKKGIRQVYRAFLSARPEKEMKIFEYMRRGFKTGKDLYSYWKEPWAREILEMGREVGNEAEKFRGILRFSELEEGMLFASINPTQNVAPILAEHFKNRLSAESWAIYDNRCSSNRGLAFENATFRHLGIEDRRNPRERMLYLPKKYWPYLTEMQDPYNVQDVSMKGLPEKKRPRNVNLNISGREFENALRSVQRKAGILEKGLPEGNKEKKDEES